MLLAFQEALQEDFVSYQKQVIQNAKVLSNALKEKGYPIISGGTDNHLLLVNVKAKTSLTGKEAETRLGKAFITVNKNTIPNDKEKPFLASGIRLGTPAVTTRGFKEKEMELVADYIDEVLSSKEEETIEKVKSKVLALTAQFPLPY